MVAPGPFLPTVLASAILVGGGRAAGRAAARARRRLHDRRGRPRGRRGGRPGRRRPRARRRARRRRAARGRRRRAGQRAVHGHRRPAGARPDPARGHRGRGDGHPDPGRGGRRAAARPHPGRRRGRRASAGACLDMAVRLRQAARAVRPHGRHVPGRQAPLRQPAARRRAGHRGRLGRPARHAGHARGRAGGGRRGGPRRARGRARGGDGHPAARRHRLHLGARLPPLPAPAPSRSPRSWTARATPRRDTARLVRPGVARTPTSTCPEEAERYRAEARAFVATLDGLDARGPPRAPGRVRATSCRTGRRRGAATRPPPSSSSSSRSCAASTCPTCGITGWNIQTISQHGTPEQAERWVGPTLRGEITWCQLFSEPGAGSDAAGDRAPAACASTAGGGSPARRCGPPGRTSRDWGFATVRTDPRRPKHAGITMMAIDLRSAGRRGPAAARAHRRGAVQRGVLRRRVRARRRAWSARSGRAGGSRGPRWATSGCRSAAAARACCR